MMETILNLGLNDRSYKLSAVTRNERFAYDAIVAFAMYSTVVIGLSKETLSIAFAP